MSTSSCVVDHFVVEYDHHEPLIPWELMSLFSEINWSLCSVTQGVTFFGGAMGVLTFNLCLREARFANL